MRQNGNGTITLEDARTWIEETGLCLFLPRRQFALSVAPSFVEAVAGQRNATPEPKQIALAEELLVRLERDGVVVRLNLLGQIGEQPDFVVAVWVLPYVYALRGDRDWRRSPQLTGSRQVSPLAVQVYKVLETSETTVSSLKHTIGRETTEAAVARGITELWQQLRIIPVIDAPGQPANWQLLKVRFQKAIAEGASTSQVTAISVLASIYLQAVIAATMEDVETFLSSLTSRSKVREVLRGLVATRQVHTIALGHAPHFYVAGTLPEFSVTPNFYTSSPMASSNYFLHAGGREAEPEEPIFAQPTAQPTVQPEAGEVEEGKPATVEAEVEAELLDVPAALAEPADAVQYAPRVTRPQAAAPAEKASARNRFSRPASHARDRKPASSSNRPARRGEDARGASSRPASARPASSRSGSQSPTSSRPASAHGREAAPSRWAGAKASNSKPATHAGATKSSASSLTPAQAGRTAHSDARPQRSTSSPAAKSGAPARKGAAPRAGAVARGTRSKPALAGTGKSSSAGKRFGYAPASRSTAKKRG